VVAWEKPAGIGCSQFWVVPFVEAVTELAARYLGLLQGVAIVACAGGHARRRPRHQAVARRTWGGRIGAGRVRRNWMLAIRGGVLLLNGAQLAVQTER
jgi:hypothetical protein